MGSICDMHNTTRVNAVLHQDPSYISWLKRLEGQTVTIEAVDYGPGGTIGTIVAEFSLRLADGSTETVTGPTLREVTDAGVCAYSLEDDYEQDELRGMLQAAIADPDNGLDERDRDALRTELDELANHYG